MSYFSDEILNNKFDKLVNSISPALEEGKLKISSADGNKDIYGLSLRLFHGALENQLRVSLIEALPGHMKADVLDSIKTNWDRLLELGEQYLNISEEEKKIIKKANYYRNRFIHEPFKFEWDELNEFFNYIDFASKWCTNQRSNYIKRNQTKLDTQNNVPREDTKELPSPEVQTWYRSSCFFWLMAIFVPPIWFLLIVTDSHISIWKKIFAFFACFLMMDFWAYILGSL